MSAGPTSKFSSDRKKQQIKILFSRSFGKIAKMSESFRCCTKKSFPDKKSGNAAFRALSKRMFHEFCLRLLGGLGGCWNP